MNKPSPEDRGVKGPRSSGSPSREELKALREFYLAAIQENPLQGFHACPEWCGDINCPRPTDDNPKGGRPRQHEFMAADNKIVAAFAGNRFGKTVGLVGWAVIQHTPLERLPERLRGFRRSRSKVTVGRYLCPSQKAIETIVLPEFRAWCPESLLRGQSWAKAYSKQHNILYFNDGGRIEFYTYEQDPTVMVGASLDYVLYDEPPPQPHFSENWIRTTDRGGCHRMGMTPVNMQGGGIGWIKREIFDRTKQDRPDFDPSITVVRGSIWDNPTISRDEITATLARYPEDERQAREHGDFIHFGGMIYPGGFERVVKPDPDPKQLEGCDIIVGIDPGLKNAAFTWHAFDRDNICFLFDEALVQEGTALDYVRAIRQINSKWRLKEPPLYVIDPSARNRSLINAESIEGELQRQGIYCMHGQNQVQAGVQQVRRRISEKGFFVAQSCTKIRGEADEYRMEDRPDGEFKVVKENDHLLDSSRYACMSRPWYPSPDFSPAEQVWTPGVAPSAAWLNAHAAEQPAPPLYLS